MRKYLLIIILLFIVFISYAEKLIRIENDVDTNEITSQKHAAVSISKIVEPLVHSLSSAKSKTDIWLNRKIDSAENKVNIAKIGVKKILQGEKVKLDLMIKKMINEAEIINNIAPDKT